LPGAPSRWSGKKDLSWVPLRPERVAEVAYDHMENGARFRHTARFRRWRPDREPGSCGFGQLEEPVRYDLARVLGGRDSVRPGRRPHGPACPRRRPYDPDDVTLITASAGSRGSGRRQGHATEVRAPLSPAV